MRSGTTLIGELLYSRYYKSPRHPHICFANDTIDDVKEFSTFLRKKGGNKSSNHRASDPYKSINFDSKILCKYLEKNKIATSDCAFSTSTIVE